MSMIHELTATVRAPACALSGADGQIVGGGMQGLFVADVRVLSEARLRVDGIEAQALAALSEAPGRTRFVGVMHGLGDADPDPTVRLERVRDLMPDGMQEQIRLRSTASQSISVSVTLDLRCDLTPIVWARAGRARPAISPGLEPNRLVWTDENVTITVTADGAQLDAETPQLRWTVALVPGVEVTLQWRLLSRWRQPILVSPREPLEWSRPHVVADDSRLARLLARSLDDVAALRLAEADDPGTTFLGAGVPWFLTLFGRDSLWAARMMLPLGTGLAESTLRVLARRQGVGVDTTTGEAPGKIMHELRRDDIQHGEHGALPHTYYGTVDATLLWINLLAQAWRWGMREEAVAALLPHLSRALSWLEHYADPDGDGFVEYIDHSGRGLANQGWKDSGTAVRFHDGSLARPPIALCEVQGYAHRAALDAAELLDAFDMGGSQRWREYAADLSDRFRQRFWVPGPFGPYPALALDGDGRAVDSLTSNIGHLLGTGLLTPAEEMAVSDVLSNPVMSGGYGLRTMSTLDAGYAPLSYHCGSVWPHDTAITLLGLAESGADGVARELITGLLAAAEAFDYRLPELYGGDGRDEVGRPIPYPAACRPQAWSAAAAVTILQAVLGLTVHVPRGEVRLRPLDGFGPLDVQNLRIAGHRVDVSVDRAGDTSVLGLPAGICWVDKGYPAGCDAAVPGPAQPPLQGTEVGVARPPLGP